jgi:hypothetical protein
MRKQLEHASLNLNRKSPAITIRSDEDRIEEHLRKKHPEWVEEDGSCQLCVGFMNELAENFTGFVGRLFSR